MDDWGYMIPGTGDTCLAGNFFDSVEPKRRLQEIYKKINLLISVHSRDRYELPMDVWGCMNPGMGGTRLASKSLIHTSCQPTLGATEPRKLRVSCGQLFMSELVLVQIRKKSFCSIHNRMLAFRNCDQRMDDWGHITPRGHVLWTIFSMSICIHFVYTFYYKKNSAGTCHFLNSVETRILNPLMVTIL